MTHELKTPPVYWDAVQRGEKNFDVRRDDRGFQKGDILELVRHNGRHVEIPDAYRDRLAHKADYTLIREIAYILTGGQFGIEPGYVVMALKEVS